ncbi:MAG: small-conductance mechanosensitive ion channel [Candidatus Dormibacteraeota bacterium]|nr:small-conductance mechanosensitive ion channel [Candidatus Dormibacteraeota bacterium]
MGQSILVSLTVALTAFLTFIPALVGALILLVIGWLLSGAIGRLVTALLQKIGFEKAATVTGVSRFVGMTGAGKGMTASRIMGELVKWFIRLIFIEMAAEALHLSAITTLINSIILFIPNLIVALVVVMIGVLVANFTAGLVRGGAGEAGFKSPNLLASIARYAIIGFAVLIALNQIGIAATLVNTLFIGLVGAIALAVGLAFGLGGREVASQLWEQWASTGVRAAAKLEKKAAEESDTTVPARRPTAS